MSAMPSQITGVPIVYSTVCSGVDQRKHQSSVSPVFVRGIHRWPMDSPHKGSVTRKMFLFDYVFVMCGGLNLRQRKSLVHEQLRRYIYIHIYIIYGVYSKRYAHASIMTSSNETFPAFLAIVRGIHRSMVDSPRKGQWRIALVFSYVRLTKVQ